MINNSERHPISYEFVHFLEARSLGSLHLRDDHVRSNPQNEKVGDNLQHVLLKSMLS